MEIHIIKLLLVFIYYILERNMMKVSTLKFRVQRTERHPNSIVCTKLTKILRKKGKIITS